MAPNNTFHPLTVQSIQDLMSTIFTAMGQSISLASSKSFRLVMECPDGVGINCALFPLDGGTVAQWFTSGLTSPSLTAVPVSVKKDGS